VIVHASNWPRYIVLESEPADFAKSKSGKPMLPKKNATYARNASGGVRLQRAQSHFRDRVRWAIKAQTLPTTLRPMALTVTQTYGRRKIIGGVDFPGMDASATLEAVCDALQSAAGFRGLVSDDAQLVDRRAVGVYAKGVYSLRIELEALPGWGE